MRIATFNILGGRSATSGRYDEEGFHAAVRLLDADLLGLQEVDRDQPRSRYADLTAVAADAMGARHRHFVAALSGRPGDWVPATEDDRPGEAAYGIAFLSRYDVRGWHVVRLPGAPVPVPHREHGRLVPRWVRDEPRVALVAEVDTPRGRIDVVTTHLSFVRPWNGRQLRSLMAHLSPRPHPLLLVGDLNLGPRRAARITGLESLAAGATYPARAPRVQLDHVLSTGGLTALGSGVVALPVSDHCSLVVDL